MAASQPLHLHPIFSSDLVTATLKRDLEQMELKPGGVDTETRSLISSHLDHILKRVETGQIDRPTAEASIRQLDQFIGEDAVLQVEEAEHLRAVDHRLVSGVFDKQHYLEQLSPLAIPVGPRDQAKVDAALEKFEPMQPAPHLPEELLTGNTSRQIATDYETGMKFLDVMQTATATGENLHNGAVALGDVLLAKRLFYREAVARLANPTASDMLVKGRIDQARRSQGVDARLYLVIHLPMAIRNAFQVAGEITPLTHYHPDLLQNLATLDTEIDDIKWTFFVSSNNPFADFSANTFTDLVDWQQVAEAGFALPPLESSAGAATLEEGLAERVNRASVLVASPRFDNQIIQSAFEKSLNDIPLEGHLDQLAAQQLHDENGILMSVRKPQEAFRFRLAVDAALAHNLREHRDGHYRAEIYGPLHSRIQMWNQYADRLFADRGWTDTYRTFLAEEGIGGGGAATESAAQVLATPEITAVENETRFTAKGFVATVGDDRVTVEIGDAFSVRGSVANLMLIVPRHDPVSEKAKVDGWFKTAPLWQRLPGYVQRYVRDAISDYFKTNERRGGGWSYIGNINIPKNPAGQQATRDRLLASAVKGLDAGNTAERVHQIHIILKSANVKTTVDIKPLEELFTPESMAQIEAGCRAQLASIHSPHDPAYAAYLLFLSDWVNVARAAPPEVSALPLRLFVEQFPAPVLTPDNVYATGEILSLLKAVPGSLYGNYIDAVTHSFEARYLEPLAVAGIAEATAVLQRLFANCGNQYLGKNFPAFARSTTQPSRENAILEEDGIVRIQSRDGRNLFDDLFETLHAVTADRLHEVMMFPEHRRTFMARVADADRGRAELLFNQYGKTLTVTLRDDTGLVDDLHDIRDLASQTDFTDLGSLRDFATTLVNRGTNKAANLPRVFGAGDAWRREMFEGQVATPTRRGTLKGDIPVMALTLKDGTELGHMYVVDMSSGRFTAEMMGRTQAEPPLSGQQVTKLKPNMVIETFGIYADNTNTGPAWAMGITGSNGRRRVLNSFWSPRVDGVIVIGKNGRSFRIVHREALVGGFEKRSRFEADFRDGKIVNYAQAQLLIYNGSNVFNGKTFISPTNTYRDQKSILGVNKEGELVVINLQQDVTFYETYEILKQLGIQAAVNMDKVGPIHDHTVDPAGKHHYDGGEGGMMNAVSRFAVSFP